MLKNDNERSADMLSASCSLTVLIPLMPHAKSAKDAKEMEFLTPIILR